MIKHSKFFRYLAMLTVGVAFFYAQNSFAQTAQFHLASKLDGFIPPALVEIASSLFIIYLAWMIGQRPDW